jgi:hypothetical protein
VKRLDSAFKPDADIHQQLDTSYSYVNTALFQRQLTFFIPRTVGDQLGRGSR